MSSHQQSQDVPVTEPLAPEIQQAPTIGVPVEGTGILTSTGSPDLQKFHGEFANFQQDYVGHYISLADTKAGFSFGIASAVLAHHLSSAEVRGLLVQPTCAAAFWISAASILLLLVSAFYSFLVIAPRLSSPSDDSVVFFGAVAKRPDADKYVADLTRLSETDLTDARLRHCYDISRICSTKYDRLKKAIWCGLPGLVGALYMLFIS